MNGVALLKYDYPSINWEQEFLNIVGKNYKKVLCKIVLGKE